MMLKKLFKQLKREHKLALFLLLLGGTVVQSLTMVRSGLLYPFGMGFWGPNGHDGIWHLALINQVFKGFPPPHPTFAGEVLTNYHYLFDLILALVQKITTISAVNLYFQIFPIILAVSLGLLSFLVGYHWQKNFWTGFWLAFLNYFAGSFGFLVTLWRYKELGGESLFWSMQSISALINPPFALSLVILLLGLFCLLRIKKFKIWQIIFLSLLFGLLIDIKVYAGVVALPALFVYSVFRLSKKEKTPFIIFTLSFLASMVTFISINRGAGSLLVFKPLWFVHSMTESPDRLFFPRLALARYALIAGRGYWKLLLVEMIGLLLFLLGNLGTRIIGLCSLVEKNIKKRNFEDIEVFFLVGGGVGLILPLLFIQKGTAWNTIQFFYYFLFFANFYAALTLSKITLLKQRTIKYAALMIIILFTIPTTLSTLRGYLGFPSPATIPFEELEALKFLQKQPDRAVLTFPYSPHLKLEKQLVAPLPLYAYETTAYTSALSGKPTYLEDEMNLEISGYSWKERRKEAEKFFISNDPIWGRGFLLNNRIGYIYLVRGQKINLGEDDLGIRLIFDNSNVRMYQVLW